MSAGAVEAARGSTRIVLGRKLEQRAGAARPAPRRPPPGCARAGSGRRAARPPPPRSSPRRRAGAAASGCLGSAQRPEAGARASGQQDGPAHQSSVASAGRCWRRSKSRGPMSASAAARIASQSLAPARASTSRPPAYSSTAVTSSPRVGALAEPAGVLGECGAEGGHRLRIERAAGGVLDREAVAAEKQHGLTPARPARLLDHCSQLDHGVELRAGGNVAQRRGRPGRSQETIQQLTPLIPGLNLPPPCDQSAVSPCSSRWPSRPPAATPTAWPTPPS